MSDAESRRFTNDRTSCSVEIAFGWSMKKRALEIPRTVTSLASLGGTADPRSNVEQAESAKAAIANTAA
jgi:hypothetical protein